MRSPLAALFRKEVRVIFRDPTVIVGTILIPLFLIPLMGSAIKVGQEATEKQLAQVDVAFLSLDDVVNNTSYTPLFFAVLSSTNVSLHNASAPDADAAVNWTLAHGYGTLVVLPHNFSEAIGAGRSAPVQVFDVLTNFGPAELGGSARVEAAAGAFNELIAANRAGASFPGAPAGEVLHPARVSTVSVIGGRVRQVDPGLVLNTVLGGSLTLPIVIAIMIVTSAQLAATSVAAEKEEKTLEVLLTLPTKRENILLGKLLGVFVVAAIGTLSVLVGFSYYTGTLTEGLPTADPSLTGLVPETQGYVLLVVTLLLSFVSSLSLAVLLASYAKDIYGAQSLMSVVYLPVFLPAVLMSVTPIEILPGAVQGAVYAIPFSYPTLAAKALFTHAYGTVWLGALYQVAFMVVVLYLAARMFSTEKVLTARLSLGRRKRNRIPEE